MEKKIDYKTIKKELEKEKNFEQAQVLQRFFKTGKGQYGEGDVFLGISVPVQREVAKRHYDLNLKDIQELLNSKIHEHRLVALLILVDKYQKEKQNKKEIFDFYLRNARKINNWDLVDLSSHHIVGEFLLENPGQKIILYELAKSDNLWEKRIAIISTFAFLRNNNVEDTIKISEILLNDKHDLIHKAVGWGLREVGKKDLAVLEEFLKKHHKAMPRTMLRYSIEKFPEEKRQKYLKGEYEN